MRFFYFFVVFFSTFLFAIEFENPTSPLRIGTELELDYEYLPFQKGRACSNPFVNCIFDTTVGFSGIAYYSTLDTTFAVFIRTLHRSTITIFSIYPSITLPSTETKLKDILKKEFMNLQDWGVINISKDSASILINKIIFEMLGGKCNWKDADDSVMAMNADIDFPNIGSHYRKDFCDSFNCCSEPIDGGTAMIDNWWTLLPEEKPTSINRVSVKNRIHISWISRKKLFVNGVKDGTSYKIFDVNGILLKQGGIYNGIVDVPKVPSILDIEQSKILLNYYF